MKNRILAMLLVIALVISNVPAVAMATEVDPTEPTEAIPQEVTPEETVPEESVPEETVPEETVPEETVPEETVPEETVPEETVPEESVPEESVPEESVPEESVPEETVPEESVPEESVPEESVPEETVHEGNPNPGKTENACTDGNEAPKADAAAQGNRPASMELITEGQWSGYYPVTNTEELDAIRYDLDGKYVLMNDIVFTSADFERGGAFYNDGAGWEPIGTYNDRFTGVFDGNGHTISNLFVNYISSYTVYAGLFGYCEATLRNVGVVNCDITGKAAESEGYANTGALAGSIQNSTVSNCYSTGTVYGTRTTGGLIGYVSPNCTVTDCYNACTVTGRGYARAYTGGLVGYINDNITVENCYNIGVVNGLLSNPTADNAFCATGGISSYVQNGEDAGPSQVINCYNAADITIECDYLGSGYANYSVGGVIGSASGTLKNCYNTGNLDTNVGNLGGVAGRLYAEASGCYNTGEINNTPLSGYHNVGGVIGVCGNGSFITHCYNTGKVYSFSRTGGIVGYAYQTVSNCYNVGSVLSGNLTTGINNQSGGIVGYSNESRIEKCWNFGDLSAGIVYKKDYLCAYAGGICGEGKSTTITDCFNVGESSTNAVPDDYYYFLYSGGIIGDLTGSGVVKNCYNVGKVRTNYMGDGYTSENAGGLAGGADDSVTFTNCYYINTNSCGVDLGDDAGTKCSPTQMLMQSTYSGFDFGSTWTMNGHSDYAYPELQSNPVKEHVQSISFASKPTKTEYLQFIDELDVSGGVLKLTYNTGKTEDKAITKDMVTGFDNTYDGELSLKVTYDSMSVYYTVKVVPMASISLTSMPAKVDYLQFQEELDLTGAALAVTYENGATRPAELTPDMVTGFDNTQAGNQALTVTLGWLKTSFQIYIVPVTGISVTKLPAKTTYLKDEHQLDVTGGQITATYENEKTAKADMTLDMVSGFDNSVPGKQTLTVSYYGKTATFDVFILCLDSIAVTKLPAKTTYLEAKEELDVTGGEITLYYNDGSTEKVAMTADMVSGFDNTVPGVQTLTVTYAGMTATFDVTIQEKTLVSLTISRLPNRLKFAQTTGRLDVTGGKLDLVYDNDSKVTIDMTTDMVSGFDNSQLGTITLTVSYGGLTTTYDVEICLIRTIELATESLHLFTGKSKTVKAKVLVHEPSLAPAKTTLVWATADKTVATVSKGKITAKGVGETVITCYAKDDPDIYATLTVKVTKAVTSIKLNKTSATITIGAGEDLGKTYQLNVKSIAPATATDKSVTWTSSNEAVATVDQNGLVTTTGAGKATIKVTANDGSGKSASCKLTVKFVKVTKVSMPSKYTMTIAAGEDLGKTYQLKATVKPANAHNQQLVWTSSKPSVATVDENGLVTSVGAGTTTIKAKAADGSGKSASCKVTVKLVKLTSVKLPKSATISIGAGESMGKTLSLNPTLKPANPYKTDLTWTSSKPAVATVDENGVVTSVAPGTTTITCKDAISGKSAKCTVKVAYKAVTKLTVSATKLKLAKGESAGLTAKVTPKDAYQQTVTWTSSNPAVVSVAADGNVAILKAEATGTATISCSCGGKTVKTKVTVVASRSGKPGSAEKNALALAVAKGIADRAVGDTDLERVSHAAWDVSIYCQNATYTSEDPDYRTPYGVFVKGVYTCAGATRAMGMVLELMGFQWKHVNENEYTHQWCSLTMDGQKGYADGQVGWAGYGEHPAA